MMEESRALASMRVDWPMRVDVNTSPGAHGDSEMYYYDFGRDGLDSRTNKCTENGTGTAQT